MTWQDSVLHWLLDRGFRSLPCVMYECPHDVADDFLQSKGAKKERTKRKLHHHLCLVSDIIHHHFLFLFMTNQSLGIPTLTGRRIRLHL